MPSDTSSTVTDLVGCYLQQIGSCVARPFTLEFQPREVDFCLEEVVRSYRDESRVVVDRQWDSLVNSLVYKHLLQVSPGLAEMFREQAHCRPTEHNLEDFVIILLGRMKKVKIDGEMKLKKKKESYASEKERKFKKVKYVTFERRHFTPEENAMILATDGSNKSLTQLARSIGRNAKVVIYKYERLCRVGTKRKVFSPLDDQIILDAVLENTHGKRLAEVSLSNKTWQKIAEKLDRMWMNVYHRWKGTLLPWLLQHSAGALNLRIEVMLSNHLLSNYIDIQSIDWTEVVKKTEFACHTVNSLKNSARKLNLPIKDVTLSHVAEYSKDLYSQGRKTRKRTLMSQRLLIDHFEQKVSQLGLTNLVKFIS